jgi:membrane AbrB-like protein
VTEGAEVAVMPPRQAVATRFALAVLTLGLGIGGGWAARAINMPLAWMIGAMITTTTASMAGVKLFVHPWLRNANISVLGVMLGASFQPGVLGRVLDWFPTVLGLAAYITCVTAILYWYFRRYAGFDPVTAYFAGSPGGLNSMVLIGREMGGDDRIIALVHGVRVLMVVLVIPIGFMFIAGYNPSMRPPAGGALADMPWREALILGACAVAGGFVGRAVRLPAPAVIGPMFLSAGVHLMGWSHATPPAILVAAAQIVLGAGIGSRFSDVSARTVLRILALGVGSTVVMLGLTVAFAMLLHDATDTSLEAVMLAYSPGGLAEMSLIALALSIDAAFVATHHVLRIMLLVSFAPFFFRLIRARRKP